MSQPVATRPVPSAPARPDRSAAIAGAFALPAITLGFSFAVLPLLAAIVLGGVILIVSVMTGTGPLGFGILSLFGLFFGTAAVAENPALVVVPLLVGLVLFALGIVGSIRYLRARGSLRPRSVTWAGLGTGLAAQLLVNGTIYLGVILGKATLSGGSASGGFLGEDVGMTVVFVALALPATAALGALLWTAFDRGFARRSLRAITPR